MGGDAPVHCVFTLVIIRGASIHCVFPVITGGGARFCNGYDGGALTQCVFAVVIGTPTRTLFWGGEESKGKFQGQVQYFRQNRCGADWRQGDSL